MPARVLVLALALVVELVQGPAAALVAVLVVALARGPSAALVGELVAVLVVALARGPAAAQWAAASSYAQAVVVDVVALGRSSLAAVSKRLASKCSTHMAVASL